MFPFLFFLPFFFSFCRIYRNFIPLSVTDFSQAGYFSLACPSLPFGNLKKSQLLFRAVRGSIGVKNRPPGNGSGYNLVTESNTLSWERVAGRSPDGCGAARGTGFVPPLFRPCGATFPQGKVKSKTLSRERVAGRSPDGCGAARGTGVGSAPLPPPAGGTFPQGKVKSKALSRERVDRAQPGTGVGRPAVPGLSRPSSAACGRHLPPGEG